MTIRHRIRALEDLDGVSPRFRRGMAVPLHQGERGPASQLLDRAEIHPREDKVGGPGMAEIVRPAAPKPRESVLGQVQPNRARPIRVSCLG